MKKNYIGLLLVLLVGELSLVGAMVSKKISAEDALELKKVRKFNAEFTTWKKQLTKVQIQHFQELFDLYEQLYRSYNARPNSVHEYELITQMTESLKNIMEHWDWFYRDYVDVQVFAKSVQDWKLSLMPEQKVKVHTALSIYTTLYDRYEAEPKNAKYLADLLQEQKVIQKLMNK